MISLLGKYKNGNGNIYIFEDGTKIRKYDGTYNPDFAENIDLKITNKCTGTNCPYCHEGSGPNGKYSDILNEKFIETLNPYTELAIGGGNVLEYPDLIPFLQRLKELKVIPNITINQFHFENNIELINNLIKEKLIYGIGISLTSPTRNFISLIRQYPNAVIHVINGIINGYEFEKLYDHHLKILILGYKQIRRGKEYYKKENELIKINQEWLYENIENLIKRFEVVSFDNLAIEQLNLKRILTEKEWDEFYMGNDGSSTFYIDAVERKFAKNSTAPMNERKNVLNDVNEMFKEIKKLQ